MNLIRTVRSRGARQFPGATIRQWHVECLPNVTWPRARPGRYAVPSASDKNAVAGRTATRGDHDGEDSSGARHDPCAYEHRCHAGTIAPGMLP